MTKRMKLLCSISLLGLFCITVGCGGCGGVKELNSDQYLEAQTSKGLTGASNPKNPDSTLQAWYDQNPQYKPITLTRNAFGKQVSFAINPMHEGGESENTVWEEPVGDPKFERTNRINQLAPSVLLYRRFPTEISKDFHYMDQPDQLEFLDKNKNTIKIVDIWKNRPYQNIKKGRITYHHQDLESGKVLPYHKQTKSEKANEYSLFTHVIAEGNHVIVNYELRSMQVAKEKDNDYEAMNVIGVKHTLLIYDLLGNLKYELKDLPSVDGAVVSNNGEYMMYVFGGMGLATANSPFATIERSGWALMHLKDQKIVYQEYTDDGKLAFNRLWYEENLLRIAYSTPSEELDYDYWVFFDQNSNSIYIHKITKSQVEQMQFDYNVSPSKFKYLNYKDKFNFQQIPLTNK